MRLEQPMKFETQFKTSSIRLETAQELADAVPGFEVPTIDEVDSIKPGMCVKIAVKTALLEIEAFWLEVDAVDNDRIAGRIVNQLTQTGQHGLYPLDVVHVRFFHVLEISD